jgi:hypothetical protein
MVKTKRTLVICVTAMAAMFEDPAMSQSRILIQATENPDENALDRYRLRDSCGFRLTSVRPSVLPEHRGARSLRVRQF